MLPECSGVCTRTVQFPFLCFLLLDVVAAGDLARRQCFWPLAGPGRAGAERLLCLCLQPALKR
jgi:hypothetical protein